MLSHSYVEITIPKLNRTKIYVTFTETDCNPSQLQPLPPPFPWSEATRYMMLYEAFIFTFQALRVRRHTVETTFHVRVQETRRKIFSNYQRPLRF